MKLKLLLFGISKDIMGSSTLDVELNGSSVHELKDWLYATYPKMKSLNSLMIAVNNEYAEDDLELKSTDEIALIPPVSGG